MADPNDTDAQTPEQPETPETLETPKPRARRRRASDTPHADAADMAAAPADEPGELPIDGAADAAAEPPNPVEVLRSETVAAVQELEVEIRNHASAPADARTTAAEALRLIRENLQRLQPPAVEQAVRMVRENVLNSDYLDADFWRGIGMVLRYQAEELSGLAQRRLRGEYTVDEYGLDSELVELVRPFAAFMYRTYWRITTVGLEYVPGEGPGLLVANQSGILPWDSAMVATAVLEEHPASRLVRSLHAPWLTVVPGMAPALAAFGQVQALPENAERLLAEGQLVCVYPEAQEAAGKLFRDRYRLTHFEAGSYIRAALRSGAPIVPVAVVGAEEIYPVLADARPLANLLRLPFFPLTPLFPWLGPLGLMPLPTKWTIVFDAPIETAEYGPAAADDDALVEQLNDQVRLRIQELLEGHAGVRRSLFW